MKQGDLGGAEQNYRELLARGVGQAAAHLGLASIAVARGNPAEAARELQYCLDNHSVHRAAYLLLAEVKQRLDDPTAAQAAMRQAAMLRPDVPWPDPFLAELVGQEGRHPDAYTSRQKMQSAGMSWTPSGTWKQSRAIIRPRFFSWRAVTAWPPGT